MKLGKKSREAFRDLTILGVETTAANNRDFTFFKSYVPNKGTPCMICIYIHTFVLKRGFTGNEYEFGVITARCVHIGGFPAVSSSI